ncbi:MAG TPA: FIST N-terminal domain-containing protein [bacterium]|nr:FIST N-terminal domain-containing protein [bacterium]
MKVASAFSTAEDTRIAVQNAYDDLMAQLAHQPDLIIAFCTSNHDFDALIDQLSEAAPNIPIHGGTSFQAVMTEQGFHSCVEFSLGLLGIYDPDGAYGVAGVELGVDPGKAVQQALTEAIRRADREGEQPSIVLLTSAPGHEETLIDDIQAVLGTQVPIIGGSSADNQVQGNCKQFTERQYFTNGLVITVLYPSVNTYFAFHSGYEPTAKRGKVTEAVGRVLLAIDGRPAAHVYNLWTDNLISEKTAPASIFAKTTFAPLGRIAGHIGEVPYYCLSHPETVTEQGGLSLFTEVNVGDEVILMKGTRDSLINRAGRVAYSALQADRIHPTRLYGALVIYCGGCMLAVGPHMPEVANNINETLTGVPFLGIFSFGEQGCFASGQNHHGNLMISMLAFGE